MIDWDRCIQSIAIDVTNSFFPNINNISIPVDIYHIASLFGYQIQEVDIPHRGYITLDKKYIKIRSKDLFMVKRFTIAHEIGHILLSKYDNKLFPKKINYRSKYGSIEEKIADRIASEILMPRDKFKYYLIHNRPSYNTLKKISKEFNVSLEASLRRITEFSDFFGFTYLYEITKTSLEEFTINLNKGFSSKQNTRFIDIPTKIIFESYFNSVSRGQTSSWEGTVKLIMGEEVEIPVFSEVYHNKDTVHVRLSGWKHSK